MTMLTENFLRGRRRMIQRDMPHLTHMLWFSTLLDDAMHREGIFRMGRLNAIGRLAHFLAETEHRLTAIDRVADGRFALPLVQIDLAEATGMTPIHLNRCVRDLRKERVADVRGPPTPDVYHSPASISSSDFRTSASTRSERGSSPSTREMVIAPIIIDQAVTANCSAPSPAP